MRIQMLNRRHLLKTAGAAVVASNMSALDVLSRPTLASELAREGKSVILLWLAGGASQLETWDPKPGRRTGGPYAKIKTQIPGIEISELLPKMANQLNETAIIRSLNTKIADHGQGYTLMDTGRIPEPGVRFPHLGSIIAHELGQIDSRVPDFVYMYTQTEGRRQDSAGYLGARYNPMFLTDKMMPDDLHRQDAITDVDHHDRAALRDFMAKRFIRDLNNPSVGSHENAYERVHGLMASDYLFDIEREPQAMARSLWSNAIRPTVLDRSTAGGSRCPVRQSCSGVVG